MSKIITGTVTSDKTDKTIVITSRTRKTHPLYKKQYTVNTKFMAHDEKNQAQVGDLVTISETKPMSARKRFKLDRIIERAGTRFEETDATADIPDEDLMPETVKPEEKKAKRQPKMQIKETNVSAEEKQG
jgi:small subunit ribosomal protein S17